MLRFDALFGFFAFLGLFLGIVLGLTPSPAYAQVHWGLWWLSTYSLPQPAVYTGNASIMGAGFSFEYLPNWSSIGIETGIYSQPQILDQKVTSHLLAPLMLRFWFSETYSIALGGFYSRALPPVEGGMASSDYGARALLGLNYPFGKTLTSALAIDMGFQYGLLNQATGGTAYTENQVVVLIGFRFGKMFHTQTHKIHGLIAPVPYSIVGN